MILGAKTINFFKIALCASIANIACLPFSASVAAIFGYILIISFFAHVLSVCFFERDKINAPFLGCVFSLFFSIIASQLQIGWFSREKVLTILFFLSFYCLLLSKNTSLNSLRLKDVYILNYILSFVFLFLAYGPTGKQYVEFNEWGALQYTLGLGNPNGTSGCVLFSISILCLQIKQSKEKLIKVFNGALLCFLISILILLASRTSFVCCFFLVVSLVLNPVKKYLLPLNICCLFVPLIMIIVQIIFIHNNFSDILFLGKKLDTGRPEMFLEILNTIEQSPSFLILGDFGSYYFQNKHNFFLSIFASLGLLGVVTILYIWIYSLSQIFSHVKNRVQENAYLLIFVFFIHSSSETMFLIGSIPYALFFLVVIKIASGEITIEDELNEAFYENSFLK